MKNIEIAAIERYNESLGAGRVPKDKMLIEQFLKVTIIHLEEDTKRLKNNTYFKDLYRRAIQAEEKALRKQPLNIDDFQEFNLYNQTKVNEIRLIAAATVILVFIAVIIRLFL